MCLFLFAVELRGYLWHLPNPQPPKERMRIWIIWNVKTGTFCPVIYQCKSEMLYLLGNGSSAGE